MASVLQFIANYAPADREFLPSRILAAVLTLAAVVLLPAIDILILFIVLGHGHFFATYYYQYKAGKIGRTYLALYALAAAVLFGSFILYPQFKLLVVAASIYFSFHFAHDEKYLLGEVPDHSQMLDILPIILLYTGYLLNLETSVLAGGPEAPVWSFRAVPHLEGGTMAYFAAAASFAVLINLFSHLRSRARFTLRKGYFLVGTVALLIIYARGQSVALEKLVGAIILFHYANWYLYYYLKYRSEPARLGSYLRTIIGINAVVIGLYFLIGRTETELPGGFLFHPAFFYIWTILHMMFTTRKPDFAYWLPQLKLQRDG